MQAIMETAFDAIYLTFVTIIGVMMLRRCGGNQQYRLFGAMAVVLGAGDAFHLIPRAIALCTTGLESYTVALGVGKLITSLTMTVFYVLLYHVWQFRYGETKRRGLTALVYVLAAARIILCLCPQNAWLRANPPLLWGILRNIPFALMGLTIIVLFARSVKAHGDKDFRYMALTIVLSFTFYIPVVLFASAIPAIGMLMIPKTLAYVGTVVIGYRAMRHDVA
ncbi:MAG: hypothetical protein PUC00_07575 [Clostridiales bacterium]|nr:hypothetical protein [Clostridiales bacterium]